MKTRFKCCMDGCGNVNCEHCHLLQNIKRITRVEVIDNTGRAYVNWHDDNDVELSFQDGGRTLKIFVGKKIKD